MTLNIFAPWISFTSQFQKDLFKKFLASQKIGWQAENETALQLDDNIYTPAILNNLQEDFEKWSQEFHPDILKEEFIKICCIVATHHGSWEELATRLDRLYEVSNYDENEDYFDVQTLLFDYTIMRCDNRFQVSDYVTCYGYDTDEIGEANCEFNNDGEFIFHYTER